MLEITIECLAPQSVREGQVQVNLKISEKDIDQLHKFALRNNIPTTIRRETFAVNKKKFIKLISSGDWVKCTVGVKCRKDQNCFDLLELSIM